LFYFVTPKAERVFLRSTELALGSKTSVQIAALTPFVFDRVCLSRSDSLGHDVSAGISSDPIIRHEVARNYVSLAFFKGGKLEKVYGFRGSEKINRNGQKYWFLSRFEGTECASARDAILEAKQFDTAVGISNEIILSGGSK
jgi:hypothetical protein